MVALWFIAGILLFFLILLLGNVKLVISVRDGQCKAWAQYFFIRYWLFGKPRKKPKKRSYRIKTFRKRIKKLLADKKEKKQQPPNGEEPSEEPSERKQAGFSLAKLKLLVGFLLPILDKLRKALHVDVSVLILSVGGEDAEQIALQYGAVIQSVQYLVTALQNTVHFRKTKHARFDVYPDFAGGNWKAEADFCLRFTLLALLSVGLKAGLGYFKFKKQNLTIEK